MNIDPALPAFLEQLGSLAEHMIGSAMWTEVQETYGQDPFATPKFYAQSFFDRFSMKPSHRAAGGTACGLVYHDALRRAETKDPGKVRDALSAVQVDLFYSHVELDARGLNANRPLVTI